MDPPMKVVTEFGTLHTMELMALANPRSSLSMIPIRYESNIGPAMFISAERMRNIAPASAAPGIRGIATMKMVDSP